MVAETLGNPRPFLWRKGIAVLEIAIMRTFCLTVAAILCLAAPGFAQAPGPAPGPARDVGSMNYPAPLPSGTITTTAPTGPRTPTDTGNMAYPAPLPQGSVNTTATSSNAPTDVGSMNYPAPRTLGTTAPHASGATTTTPGK